jgi:hypothetical protein
MKTVRGTYFPETSDYKATIKSLTIARFGKEGIQRSFWLVDANTIR